MWPAAPNFDQQLPMTTLGELERDLSKAKSDFAQLDGERSDGVQRRDEREAPGDY